MQTDKNTTRSTVRSTLLDIVRAIASLLVLLGHIRCIMLVDYHQQEGLSVFSSFFYFLSGLGNQAVIIFFALSGHLIGGKLWREKSFSCTEYIFDRTIRFWVVMVPCLVSTYVLDLSTDAIDNRVLRGDFYETWNSGPRETQYSVSLVTLLGNLFFFQGICLPVFGSNTPLWSLAYEYWYYMLFPVIIYLLRSGRKSAYLLFLSISLAIVIVMPKDFTVGFIVWVSGAMASGLKYWNGKYVSLCFWTIVFFVVLSLVLSKHTLGRDYPELSNFSIGLSVSILLCFRHFFDDFCSTQMISKISFLIASRSFTLYAMHFPFLLFLASAFPSYTQQSFGVMVVVQIGFVAAFLCFLSNIVWYIFERNTFVLKRMIHRFLFSFKTPLQFRRPL